MTYLETKSTNYDDLSKAEYFHILVNIENYSDFLPKAQEIALNSFNSTSSNVPNYEPFDYTPEAFDERMTKIYDDLVAGTDKPYWLDTGELSNGSKVGRFSDRAVKERLRQFAPFNLLDGAWLQNILATGPCTETQANLFSIWADEAGNGRTDQNHCNVYETLLRSLNIYLPPIKSRAFIEEDFLPSAFENPVFQMCVGLFPEKFLPELLGMTLHLEWESTPSLMPFVKCLQGRNIDPQFFSLHVAIDNIANGHGALAKQSVELYLDEIRERGGDRLVQEYWKRIWNGYVTWATLGSFGEDLNNLLLEIDGKVSPDARNRYFEKKMIALVERLGRVARKSHGTKRLGSTDKTINSFFQEPSSLLKALVNEGYINIDRPRESRFFEYLDFSGPMYKVFTEEDKDTILDWIESLRSNGTPSSGKPDIGRQMAELIHAKARAGRRSHTSKSLPEESGVQRLINDWFDNPRGFMQALIRGNNPWITPGSIENSRFFTLINPGGVMASVFSETERDTIRQWVEAGAPQPEEVPLGAPPSSKVYFSNLSAEVSDPQRAIPFAQRRRLMGMGSVH